MESWRDRFSKEEHVEIDGILKGLFEKDREHFEFVVWTILNVTIYMLFLIDKWWTVDMQFSFLFENMFYVVST